MKFLERQIEVPAPPTYNKIGGIKIQSKRNRSHGRNRTTILKFRKYFPGCLIIFARRRTCDRRSLEEFILTQATLLKRQIPSRYHWNLVKTTWTIRGKIFLLPGRIVLRICETSLRICWEQRIERRQQSIFQSGDSNLPPRIVALIFFPRLLSSSLSPAILTCFVLPVAVFVRLIELDCLKHFFSSLSQMG